MKEIKQCPVCQSRKISQKGSEMRCNNCGYTHSDKEEAYVKTLNETK